MPGFLPTAWWAGEGAASGGDLNPDALIPHHGGPRAVVRGSHWDGASGRKARAQAASRRMTGTLMGREPGPPTCEKGCVRQSSP
ncbi:hypothetical protein GCM10010255_61110 [Streptomyces coeruleofuscus]|uniref:Uncharacterized protein n=1 Tax=Streptomyces coeruleofuscus TaxID=66879 RepID=A0ABP5VYS0_9ACTN